MENFRVCFSRPWKSLFILWRNIFIIEENSVIKTFKFSKCWMQTSYLHNFNENIIDWVFESGMNAIFCNKSMGKHIKKILLANVYEDALILTEDVVLLYL